MRCRFVAFAAALLLPVMSAFGAAPPVIHHTADVSLDIEAHAVTVYDRLTLPAGLSELAVGRGMTIEEFDAAPEGWSPRRVEDEHGVRQVIDLAEVGLAGGGQAVLRLRGVFHQPTDAVSFSRENVGGEINATVGEEGVWLSAGAGWLPWADGVMNTFDLTVREPAGFASVTQGARTVLEPGVTRWLANHPSDGLNLVANRFVVHEEQVQDGITAYTFFLADEPRLRATYMERTRAYIAMYEEMIGPYPYAKFATVENWFPTGYGMPGWTLLGSQVLRLPFIPTTSFGHEIAHNWWGNSVFVDAEQGNWCEGLTSWSADYHYKELESPEAAREYRRNLLKDYYAYVGDPAADFSLRAFKSRHSGATRAVGYGKSMMVFHMLDRMVGRERFLEGLQRVYAERQFTAASWDDFLAVLGELGGFDPAPFAAQWLDRTGAPVLALGKVEFADDKVVFTLQQAEPVYTLDVPVRVDGAAGPVVHTVRVDRAGQEITLPAERPSRVAVDPDFDLFRRLHVQEVEPTLSQVLAEEVPTVVSGDEAGHEAARRFGEAFADGRYFNFIDSGTPPSDLPRGKGQANIVINPSPDVARLYSRPEVIVAGRTLVLEGKRYSLDKFDLVYCAANPFEAGVTDLVVICGDPQRLAGLGSRLGHYGKYSWLLLPAGQGRVERGNWTPAASPLAASR